MKNIPGVSNSFNDIKKSITNNDPKSTDIALESTDIEKVINSDGLVQSDKVDSTVIWSEHFRSFISKKS